MSYRNSRGSANSVLYDAMQEMRDLQDRQIEAINRMTDTLTNGLSAKSTSSSSTPDTQKLTNAIGALQESVESTTRSLSDMQKKEDSLEDKRKTSVENTSINFSRLSSEVLSFTKSIDSATKRFSEFNNQLIHMTGLSASMTRDIQSSLRNTVSVLNTQTGDYFNVSDAYQTIIKAFTTVGIGRADEIAELSRPLLLANESLNLNTSELVTMMNKLYTRYNFSSQNMEDVLNNIASNTAGNNATAEAVQKNFNTMYDAITLSANGDKSYIENALNSITETTSRLESAGIDTSTIYEAITAAYTGDISSDQYQKMNAIVGSSGTGVSLSEYVKNLRDTGDASSLVEAYMQGVSNISDLAKNSYATATATNVYGLSTHEMANLSEGLRILSDHDSWRPSSTTMTDIVEEQYVTATDRLNNNLSQITSILSNARDSLGIGITDVFQMYGLLKLSKASKGLLSKGGSVATSAEASATEGGLFGNLISRGSTSIKGALAGTTKAGLAAGGSMIVGGGLGIYDGFQGMFDKGKSQTYQAMSAAEVAAGGTAVGMGLATATGAVAITNPVGWIALASAALIAGGKRVYEEQTRLAGDAGNIASKMQDAKDAIEGYVNSLQEKSKNTLSNFYSAKDKSEYMSSIGFNLTGNESDEELEKMMVDYYNNVSSIDPDSIAKSTNNLLSSKAKDQQKNLVDSLSGITDNESRLTIANYLLQTQGKDSKIGKDITKYLKSRYSEDENRITDTEWSKILNNKSILNGFGDDSLSEISLDRGLYNTLNSIAGVSGQSYTDYSSYQEAINKDIANIDDALSLNNIDKVKSIIESSNEKGYASLLVESYNNSHLKGLPQEVTEGVSKGRSNKFARGTNYVSNDQFAVIHEGEAIIPKAYNPQANRTELEMLREYYSKNTSSNDTQLTEVLSAILAIITDWKTSTDERNMINDRNNRFDRYSNVSSYMTSGAYN